MIAGQIRGEAPSLPWHTRVAAEWRSRWPRMRRRMLVDGAILLVLWLVTRMFAVAWVYTDSLHASVAVVLKGAPVKPGQVAVIAYAGGQLPHYYRATSVTRALAWLGVDWTSEGPRPGSLQAKYLVGVEGDRIEVDGRDVYLSTRQGRFSVGRAKPVSRYGDPLEPIHPQVIPPGFVYVWAPSPDALDSRYAIAGLVPVGRIAGRAIPIL